jgi:uncharacterized phage protein (TIGR02220 family)
MKSVARIVRTDFWTSKMAMDMFSAEDMYFMLYLMTNPHTTQLGIYQINKKYMCLEFKHSLESVNSIMDRFENKHGIIKYSPETDEIAIKNYLENSIITGGKPVEDCLRKEINNVKDKRLLEFVYQYLKDNHNLNDTVLTILPLLHHKEYDNDNDNERVVPRVADSNAKNDNPKLPSIHNDVIDYLNKKTGKKYKSTTQIIQSIIKARQNEGFALQDFYDVIDIKCSQWLNDANMYKYLRPSTLFAPTHFQEYLNEAPKSNSATTSTDKTPEYDANGYRTVSF